MESYTEWVREIGGAVIKVNPDMKPIFHSLSLKDGKSEKEKNVLVIGKMGVGKVFPGDTKMQGRKEE
ncbi:hypothetical protein ABD68_11235 [Bacillus endophyticus]|uniref:hypothetical protein n=1 Tax=Priestia endophytica TaxID=135735 RepID=UPI0018CF1405|nr:hypothetical protein [Priestia endophytica]MBG9812166.1 hypothetical protein [Priestia endophytica]